jgi:tetratricopeptide (TPR) repeat protein
MPHPHHRGIKLDLVDQLASKSLAVAEPAAGGTRYRMLETIRQYAAERLAEAGEAGPARRRHAEAFLRLAENERELPVLLHEQDNFRAALGYALAAGDATGPRLTRALGGFWLARGLLQEARGWLERALAAGPADQQLRADLHRLLGAVLYAAGDLERTRDILAQGSQVAEAAGLSPVQARIRALRAEIQATQDGNFARAIEAGEQSAAVLESEGDLEGLAEAWLSAGRLRFWAGAPGASEALERAAACARQSGNHHAEQESRTWLAATLWDLPIPIHVAAGRAERLLEAASGDPWDEAAILHPLSLTYGYAGRFAEARAASRRAQSILAAAGAKLDWARCVYLAGRIELMAGDPAAAEQALREGYEALRAISVRGDRANIVTLLAEAACAQGRLGEALAGAGDFDAQGRWRATRAKLLGPARPVRRRRPAGRGGGGAGPGDVRRAGTGRVPGGAGGGGAAGGRGRPGRRQPAPGAAVLPGPAASSTALATREGPRCPHVAIGWGVELDSPERQPAPKANVAFHLDDDRSGERGAGDDSAPPWPSSQPHRGRRCPVSIDVA